LISSVSFGKFLLSAITSYKAENYIEANSVIDKALLINKSDFTAKFWKMRIAVMQEKYQEAINLIEELKLATKLVDLIIPWEEFCLNQINQTNNTNIDALNNETNDQLEYFQHHRTFRFLDIIYTVLMFVGIAIILTPFKLSGDMSGIMIGLIYTPLISAYYYYKTSLIPNIYISTYYGVNKIRRLVISKPFRWYCLFLIIDNLRKGEDRIIHNNFAIFIILSFFYPVFEEIFYRGFLYGYLQRYGRKLSWFMVTVVFYASHMELANIWHIVLSIMCLYIYDQEKTILAPMIIHLVNNTIVNFSLFIR
jgi:membrane protease YdiL (CAAX protease family)